MNVAIEMHDSECLSIESGEAGDGSVLLDAYVHRAEGEPGVAPGQGGVQRIRMKLEGMCVEGHVGELPANVYEGSLTVGDYLQDNMVPFPAVYSEPVCLRMMLSDDARVIAVSAKKLSIEIEGEFRYLEEFTGQLLVKLPTSSPEMPPDEKHAPHPPVTQSPPPKHPPPRDSSPCNSAPPPPEVQTPKQHPL